jgi:hypothetical protein
MEATEQPKDKETVEKAVQMGNEKCEDCKKIWLQCSCMAKSLNKRL